MSDKTRPDTCARSLCDFFAARVNLLVLKGERRSTEIPNNEESNGKEREKSTGIGVYRACSLLGGSG